MRVSPRIRKWLTGPKSDPSVRARFWLEVERRPPHDTRVREAVKTIGKEGWAASLLEDQWPDGHWVTPGTSGGELYRPKYVATNWQAIVLADLGMTRADPRIHRTAPLLTDRWIRQGGDLSGRGGGICSTVTVGRTVMPVV